MKTFSVARVSAFCIFSLLWMTLSHGAQIQPVDLFKHDLQDMQRQTARLAWENPKKSIAELVSQGMYSDITISSKTKFDQETEEQITKPDVDATMRQAFEDLDKLLQEYYDAGAGLLPKRGVMFNPQKARELLSPQKQFSLNRKMESIRRFIVNNTSGRENAVWFEKFIGYIGHFEVATETLQRQLKERR